MDEGQDLNRSSLLFLQRCVLDAGTALCVVGDAQQAIYAFRGALTRSMQEIPRHHVAPVLRLSLTVCYRCPRRVAYLAAQLNPLIRAASGVHLGHIRLHRGDVGPAYLRSQLTLAARTAVLSRTNGAILALLIHLFRDGLSARWVSPSIQGQLRTLLGGVAGPTGVRALRQCADHPENATGLWCGDGDPATVFGLLDSTVLSILDAAADLDGPEATVEQSAWLAFVCDSLDDGADDNAERQRLVLATVHSAKGMEYPHVIVLDYDLFGPRVGDDNGDRAQQECNLLYIAITRAMDRLTLVQSPRRRARSALLPEEIVRYAQELWAAD